jgi:hypothetical protein
MLASTPAPQRRGKSKSYRWLMVWRIREWMSSCRPMHGEGDWGKRGVGGQNLEDTIRARPVPDLPVLQGDGRVLEQQKRSRQLL